MKATLFSMIVSSLLVTGCDRAFEKIADVMTGTEKNIVVLSSAPLQLSPTVTGFEPEKPAVVVGGDASLCLSLVGGFPLANNDVMNEKYSSIMQGAEVRATAYATDGRVFYLTRRSQSWSLYGKVEPEDELSACVKVKCGEAIPVGTQFSKFDVSTTGPVDVRGVSWESKNAFDNIN